MLRNGIFQDTFGMLGFLRLIGLRIDGSMLNFLPSMETHNILMSKKEYQLGKGVI